MQTTDFAKPKSSYRNLYVFQKAEAILENGGIKEQLFNARINFRKNKTHEA